MSSKRSKLLIRILEAEDIKKTMYYLAFLAIALNLVIWVQNISLEIRLASIFVSDFILILVFVAFHSHKKQGPARKT